MSSNRTTTSSRIRRWIWRGALLIASPILIYAAFLVLGFVPIHANYQPPPGEDRVRLFVRSNEIHTDIVMPTVHEELAVDWREVFPPRDFAASTAAAPYVAVGWGNRRFFLETPTWAEFKLSAAVGALFWPSESVLHVEYLSSGAPGPWMREVFVTRAQYAELVRFVRSSVGKCDSKGCAITASQVTYGPADRFYASGGKYHCFNTCNQWTGRGLAKAGLPVGIWTPMKQQVLCWLPESSPGLTEGRNQPGAE
jgi:uncharacterized protein (TIGR02117 family)